MPQKKTGRLDTVTLNFHSNLLLGNVRQYKDANIAVLAEVMNRERKAIGEFGFWDSAAPNFSQYYPQLKPEELKPSEADYIFPIFRALSEVIVHKQYNPIDFCKNNVIKQSMGMLKGQAVYPNHEMSIGNELGVVMQEVWQDSYETADGILIPAGINTELRIDGKINPAIARNINSDPPTIHSTSVSVSFKWEKSHPEMDEDTFWAKLGKLGPDGNLVTRVVIEVMNYGEISLVPHGADPFAQKIAGDGKIVNPRYANRVYNSAEKQDSKIFLFRYNNYVDEIKNSTIPDNSNNNEEEEETLTDNTPKMKKETIALLLALAGLQATETNEDSIHNAMVTFKGSFDKLSSDLSAATTKLTTVEADLGTAQLEVTRLKAFEEPATAALTAIRNSAVAAYKLSMGTAFQPAMVENIEKADFAAATAFQSQYELEVENKYPVKCTDCGSNKVSRQTAVIDPKTSTEKVSLVERMRQKQRQPNMHPTLTPIV